MKVYEGILGYTPLPPPLEDEEEEKKWEAVRAGVEVSGGARGRGGGEGGEGGRGGRHGGSHKALPTTWPPGTHPTVPEACSAASVCKKTTMPPQMIT